MALFAAAGRRIEAGLILIDLDGIAVRERGRSEKCEEIGACPKSS